MAEEAPPTEGDESVGKALAIMAVIGILVLGVLGGIIYAFLRYGMPALTPEVAEEEQHATEVADTPGEPEPDSTEQAGAPIAPERTDEPSSVHRTPTPAPPPTPPPAPSDLNLAWHMDKVREHLAFSAVSYDVRHICLSVSNVTASISLTIPPGIRFRPKSGEETPAFVTCQPRTVNLEPTQGVGTFYLKVASMDATSFRVAKRDIPMTVDSPPEDDPLAPLLSYTTALTSSWNTVQTGIWVLNSNLSQKELSACSMTVKDPSAPGMTRVAPVASFEVIREAEGLIAALNKSPNDYRLFTDVQEEFTGLIEALQDPRNPDPDHLAVLKGKALLKYGGDPAVESILRRHIIENPAYEGRRHALINLIPAGLSGNTSSLFYSAMGDSNIYIRFLAALTLFRKGEEASWPLLALHGEDIVLKDFMPPELEAAIKAASGEPRRPNEALYPYWERAVGWDVLGKAMQNSDLERVRRSVQRFNPKPDPKFIKALQELRSPDENVARRACSTLRQFPRNAAAFKALCGTAATHKSANIRRDALYSLRSFTDFNAGTVCSRILQRDEDRVVDAAIDLAAHCRFTGYASFLIQAAKHRSAAVRRRTVTAMSNCKLTAADDTLLRLAKQDPDRHVKIEALNALCRMRRVTALTLLRPMLNSADRSTKYAALTGLRYWEDDRRALDILEKYRSDKVIGSQVVSHLKRYGR